MATSKIHKLNSGALVDEKLSPHEIELIKLFRTLEEFGRMEISVNQNGRQFSVVVMNPKKHTFIL